MWDHGPVCACSLRTQQGACKASAKVCTYHPRDDSFGCTAEAVLPGFLNSLLESLILAQDERWR
ncbi:hypothetical protein ACFOZ4_29840, partial [Hamadaea flava]